MERTLVIIKPSGVQRGLCGEVITRFERKGLKIVALKMYQFTMEKCAEHYSHLAGKPFFPVLAASMMASPCVLMCVEGLDAVSVVRTMTGATDGKKAAPGTIRGDFSLSHQENIVHASDTIENAAVELERFFNKEDYFDYKQNSFNYIYAADEI